MDEYVMLDPSKTSKVRNREYKSKLSLVGEDWGSI